jgi:hypothetical protein
LGKRIRESRELLTERLQCEGGAKDDGKVSDLISQLYFPFKGLRNSLKETQLLHLEILKKMREAISASSPFHQEDGFITYSLIILFPNRKQTEAGERV